MTKKLKLSQGAKTAILLGIMCSISYYSVYVARNILGVVTPQMLGDGFTEEYIGSISSLYFVTYALGQLINGAIGDRIKARWMICTGLCGAGVTNLLFSLVTANKTAALLAYAATGIFLSMIYGPMTRLVSENTEHIYAVRCNIGYTFASLFASPTAGLLASFLAWQNVFTVSSIALFTMSVVCFSVFFTFEKKGLITSRQRSAEKGEMPSFKVLFKHQIVKFSLISILTGVVRTSVIFWLPTYLNQHLGFSETQASGIFTALTLILSMNAFISLFLYERLGRNMHLQILLMFCSSFVFFLLTFFVSHPILNIVCILLAIMSSGGASCMLWSVYCPSLRETGRVSSAVGFLDFLSYIGASIANIVFANAVNVIGWGNLILVWAGIMVLGILVSLPYRKIAGLKRP